jgi:hypothetical protein
VVALEERWTSEEVWCRTLLVRAGIMWVLQAELVQLEVGGFESLREVLARAQNLTYGASRTSSSDQEAFSTTIRYLQEEIRRYVELNGADENLERVSTLLAYSELFDVIADIFCRIRQNSGRAYAGLRPRRVTLDRKWINNHPMRERRPGEYSDPYHVDARTLVSAAAARVQLRVHLDSFDELSLAAIPALLTHELICHAHAREDRSDAQSIWAEGVMDWASVFFFEKWASRLGLPYGLALLHGKDLWDRRLTKPRRSGHMAAMALVAWLATEPGIRCVRVARPTAVRLALELNAAEATLQAKDEFASRLANIQRDTHLREGLRAWLDRSAGAATLV